MTSCPHCHRPFAPEIRVGGYVRQQLYEFVKSRPQGVTRKQIEDAIYATHHTGGPEHAAKSIYVMIHKINKILQGYGMRIRAHRGAGAIYQLSPIPENSGDLPRDSIPHTQKGVPDFACRLAFQPPNL